MELQFPQQFYQHDVQSVVDWFVPLDDRRPPSSSTQAVTMNVNLDASGMTAALLENCLSVTTLCTRWAVAPPSSSAMAMAQEEEEQHPRPPQRIVSRVYAARVLQAALLQMASTSATDTATTVSMQKHCDITQCRVVTSSIVTNQKSHTLHQNKDAPNKVVVDNNNNNDDDDDANDDDDDEAITIPCTSKCILTLTAYVFLYKYFPFSTISSHNWIQLETSFSIGHSTIGPFPTPATRFIRL
jgi:hypothetical protein